MSAATLLAVVVLSVVLSGCSAGVHDASTSRALPQGVSAPTLIASTSTPKPAAAPVFPSPEPGVTADPASLAVARQRLVSLVLPPGAVASAQRLDIVPPPWTMRFLCQPMARVVGYWAVPNVSAQSVGDFLAAHAPRGLTLVGSVEQHTTGGGAEGWSVEYAATPDAQNGLIYDVSAVGSGADIRAESLEVPSNATCATPPPGVILEAWGG